MGAVVVDVDAAVVIVVVDVDVVVDATVVFAVGAGVVDVVSLVVVDDGEACAASVAFTPTNAWLCVESSFFSLFTVGSSSNIIVVADVVCETVLLLEGA